MKSVKIMILGLLLWCGIGQVSAQYSNNPAQDQGIFWQIMDSVRHGIQTVVTGIWNFVVVKPITFVSSLIFGTEQKPKKVSHKQEEQRQQPSPHQPVDSQEKKEIIQKAIEPSQLINQEASSKNLNVIIEEKVKEEEKKELTDAEQEERDLQEALKLSKEESQNNNEPVDQITIEEDFLAQDDDGNTSLHRAISENQQEEVMRILDEVKKQDKTVTLLKTFNHESQSPLHLAVQNKNEKAIESIINAYPNSIRIKNDFDLTPSELAEYNNNNLLALQMRAFAAQIRILSGDTRILINSLKDNPNFDQQKIEALLKLKNSLNDKDDDNNTPLHIAAQNGKTNIVQYLIDQGAIINQQNNQAKTPAQLAEDNGHNETAEAIRNRH